MREYRTVAARGEGEIIIKKSRFIGQVSPVADEEEAAQFVTEIKKKHYEARHNCHAWLIDSLNQRSSDDGEPSGTGGRPILEVLRRERLEQVAVVVSRYFGGILLGANGLVRAYAQACKVGLLAAKMGRMAACRELEVVVDYGLYGRLENLIREESIPILASQFGEQVTVTMGLPIVKVEPIREWLREHSSGQAISVPGKHYYRFIEEARE